jgi:hypothetical protein
MDEEKESRMSDIEDMIEAFKTTYLEMIKQQEIAKRDATQEMHEHHIDMDEMAAWDSYAIAFLGRMDVDVLGGSPEKASDTLKTMAIVSATFANEMIFHRRTAFHQNVNSSEEKEKN